MKEGINDIPIRSSLLIRVQNGRPTVEIRRNISDFDTIKKLVTAAFRREPVPVLPSFHNEIQAVAQLQEKGIIYRDDSGDWKYTF